MRVIAKFLPVLALFFLFPAASSESLSGITIASGALYSEWSAALAASEVSPVPVRYGSFTVSRPQSELFIGGLAARWRAELSGLASAEQFEEFALRRFRAEIATEITTDGGSADIGDWLSTRGGGAHTRLLTGSADYLTSYLTGMAERSASGLPFVRNVEWDYQSPLGERRWSTGLSALGALREGGDDAVVWQMRAFAAEEEAKGANAGLIYRRVADSGLIGVNAFLDYEVNSDYDKAFWRGSLGAEYRSAIINVYLNRYFGITDGVRRDDGWVYTRNGIDAELDIQVPDFPLGGFSGGVTYYRWEGEYGDEDDKGFRYHLQLQPFGLGARLRFRLEFDSPDVGSAEWGGAVSYSYLFGAPSPSSAVAAASGFDPRAHFFDPARREYSQRIVRSGGGGSGGDQINYGWVAGTAYVSPVGADAVTLTAAADGRNFPRPHTITASTEAASTLRVATGTAGEGWTVGVYQLGTVVFTAEDRTNISIAAGTITIQQSGSDIGVVRLTTAEITLLGTALEIGLNSDGDEIFIELEEGGVDIVILHDDIRVLAAHEGETVTVVADSLGRVKAEIRIVDGAITVVSEEQPPTTTVRSQIVVVGGISEPLSHNNVWRSTGAGVSLTLAGPDSFPLPIDSAALAALGSTLYLSGGLDSGSNFLNAVWRSVDGGANWVSIGIFADAARYGHSMVSYNDKLYIIGGLFSLFDFSSFVSSGEVFSSSDGVNWDEAGTIETTLTGVTGGYGRSAVVHNNTLFIIGGETIRNFNSIAFTDSFAIDEDGTIHTLAVSNNLPAYANAAAVSFKGTIYRIGGEDSDSNPQNDIWSSVDGENWTRSGNFLVPISAHQALVSGEGIYVLGGRDGVGAYNRVWYSTNATDWRELSNMPGARFLHAATVYPTPSP